MPEGFSALTQTQKKSYITSFLYHMSDMEDASDWEPVKVEPVDESKVKVFFNSGKSLHYKDGEWDE